MDQLLQHIDSFVRSDWVNTAVSVVVILFLTALLARFVTHFLRRVLNFNEEKDLPSSSIFVNIARGAVWILGICIMLDTSFNVNVSALIAALGVGGIAISLGFQDTISNLIGGLQVSLLRIVKPGDNIEVGSSTGVVKDITWRHTTIRNSAGEEVIIPNSIINKTALTHLPPTNQVKLPVVVATQGERLDEVTAAIEHAAADAARSTGKVTKEPKLAFTAITDGGFQGTIAFTMADSRTGARAADAVVRAIAPLTRTGALQKAEGVLDQADQGDEGTKAAATDAPQRHKPKPRRKQKAKPGFRSRMARALRMDEGGRS